MKTNGDYTGGKIKPDMYQIWADYFLKFLDVYKKHGVEFWGITTGNEPVLGYFPFVGINSVSWTSEEVVSFV